MQPISTIQKEQNTMGFYLLAVASAALAVTITLTNLEQLLRICGAVLFLVSSALSLITAWRNSRR